MRHPRRWLVAAVAVATLVGIAVAVVNSDNGRAPETTAPPGPVSSPPVPGEAPLGAFLGSGEEGVEQVAGFQAWLDGPPVTVGHTYLAGQNWSDIEGDPEILGPWSAWASAKPGRMLVINVPMLAPNEPGLPDAQVAALLKQGAAGAFDRHYQVLAQRLVADHVPNAVLVLGWEMNGITYSGRCGPDPASWKAYFRRIVGVMRAVPGTHFRFDFDPNRGLDSIPWSSCYPGDDVVDILGMDTYDQVPGTTFADYVNQPYGLAAYADFAEQHHKPQSFPEWGLATHGDDEAYIIGMYDWISSHNVAYQTITDYCPHGVWSCSTGNAKSAAAYRALFGGHGTPPPL